MANIHSPSWCYVQEHTPSGKITRKFVQFWRPLASDALRRGRVIYTWYTAVSPLAFIEWVHLHACIRECCLSRPRDYGYLCKSERINCCPRRRRQLQPHHLYQIYMKLSYVQTKMHSEKANNKNNKSSKKNPSSRTPLLTSRPI